MGGSVRKNATRLGLVVLGMAAAVLADEEGSGESTLVQILRAMEAGNPRATQTVLESGNIADPTVIHTCAQKGFHAAASMLLEHGARADQQFQHFGTPLHTAISSGQKKMAKLMIAHGSRVDEPNGHGFRPLHLAAQHGHAKEAKFLISKGAKVNDQPGSRSPSPLHMAVVGNHVEVAQVLLTHEAVVDAAMDKGITPLHAAADAGAEAAVRLLLGAGASVGAEDARGFTPLHISAARSSPRHLSIIELLVSHKAEVDFMAGDMNTPLHIAAEEDNAEGVQALVRLGANLEAVNSKGVTPLYRAVYLGRPRAAAALLAAGAKATVWSHKMLTPLHEAAQERRTEEVALLLAGGADVDPPDMVGATPLAHAAREGYPDIAEQLLAGGAECLRGDESGVTAVHAAAQEGHVEALRTLLGRCGPGAVGVESYAGHTPLHAAAYEGQVGAVGELLARGAEPEARTKGGLTALQVAVRSLGAQHAVVALLKEHCADGCLELRGGGAEDGVCAGADGESMVESMGGGGKWPWEDPAALEVVGAANVSFNIHAGKVASVETHQMPLHALPVLSPEAVVRGGEGKKGTLLTAPHVQSAAVNTGPRLAEAARRTLLEVKRLRRALSAQMEVSSRRFWSAHWPMTTMKEMTARASEDKGNRDAPLLREMQEVIEAMVERMEEVFAPLLGCTVEKLQCPDFGVYYRIDPDHYLSYVHLDFPSEAEARWNHARGLTRDDWWNVWVLLSDCPFGGPLAVLDPGPAVQAGKAAPGFMEPTAEMLGNATGAAAAAGGKTAWRAFTYKDMRQGDAILWRTTKVPHAGARLVRAPGAEWEESLVTAHQRESIDVRCVCLKS